MKASESEPGFAILKSARDERFANIVAEADGGLTLVEAWCQSDPAEVKPEVTAGRRVGASKAHKRVAARVAYIKRQNASQTPTAALTTEILSTLMAEVTSALMVGARAAQDAGAENIAQQLRKCITVHAGRSERVEHRAPAPVENHHEIDVDLIVKRFHPCTCMAAS
jgi:hypothetical protein